MTRTVTTEPVERDGKVAMAYFQPHTVPVTVNGHTYVFGVNRNISFAWVDKADYPAILAVTKVCCGNNKTHPFRLAHGGDVRVWENTAER